MTLRIDQDDSVHPGAYILSWSLPSLFSKIKWENYCSRFILKFPHTIARCSQMTPQELLSLLAPATAAILGQQPRGVGYYQSLCDAFADAVHIADPGLWGQSEEWTEKQISLGSEKFLGPRDKMRGVKGNLLMPRSAGRTWLSRADSEDRHFWGACLLCNPWDLWPELISSFSVPSLR